MNKKTLILVRHAKSDWSGNEDDHDRPLQRKGIKRAERQSQKLAKLVENQPSFWISSTAKRAADTAVIFSDAFRPLPEIHFDQALYTFSPSALIAEIRKFPDSHRSCIVFCHNEAITYAAIELGNQFIENVTTAGMVCIRFAEEEWKNIGKGVTEWIHLGKK